ncbi:DUF4435 domain-containing protein [Candidatus Thiosymbion oneisti]|uniref:DUF4435 domain-containing protein n=1 Tax=Candidatus Thiosymbion oneisti TaxID=589554 RepID=UPI000B7F9453|nr:DUF4435 domain-containing protein [Candidatus Thiosymbion oneisti]
MKPASWTKDAAHIENEIIMGRHTHRGSFLLLEGEDDHKFWDRRVSQGCELVIGDGKPNVEGAIIRLDTRRFSGALGVVDDDFDRLQGRALPSPNLLATDAHDLILAISNHGSTRIGLHPCRSVFIRGSLSGCYLH